MLVVGALGGYTTFSAYALEVVSLLQHGRIVRTGAYLLTSNVLALTACYAGILIARRLV